MFSAIGPPPISVTQLVGEEQELPSPLLFFGQIVWELCRPEIFQRFVEIPLAITRFLSTKEPSNCLRRPLIRRENRGVVFSASRAGTRGRRDFLLPSPLLLFLEIGVNKSADELSAGALHAGNDGADAIRSGTIKVGRDSDVLLQTSCVQD